MSYTLISTQTVGAGGAATIDFTNIPQIYTDLYVVYSTRPGSTDGSWVQYVYFNGLTTNRSSKILEGSGSTAASYTQSITNTINEAFTATANTFSNGGIYIPNYTGGVAKPVSLEGVSENLASTAYQWVVAGLWNSNSAITQVTLGAPSTYAQYSTATLYGVNRIPTASLGTTPTVDYLVVAGGGAGASNVGGGGGAGGLLTGSSFSVTSGSALTVTVGAGGAGAGNAAGSNGSNSVFSSITTTGGGHGGQAQNNDATSGGSGGGASRVGASTGTVGAGTAGQGNAGGTGSSDGTTYTTAGGGGGAGSAGVNATSSAGGNGGTGVSVTLTGSSMVLAAGGGGGGNSGRTLGIGGSGIGGNASDSSVGTNGAANTGSGGGGGGSTATAGGSGGSGVVVIRYPDKYTAPTSVTGSPMVTYVNGYRVYTWTASGTITF